METSAYGDPYKSCSSYTALLWAGKTRILSSNTKNSMDTKCQVILLQFKCRSRVCTPRTGWPFHPLYYRSVLKTKLTCSSLSLLQITRCTVPALPRPAPVVTGILSSLSPLYHKDLFFWGCLNTPCFMDMDLSVGFLQPNPSHLKGSLEKILFYIQ